MIERMRYIDWLVLFGLILLSQVAGFIGSLAMTAESAAWYAALAFPTLAPPGWVFGPVWTLLYALMGVAAFIVWRARHQAGSILALVFFFVQLALNALWSVAFFGLQSVSLALAEISILWLMLAATLVFFARVSKIATWLLVPYLLWVTFAAYLAFEFWRLNG